MKKKKENLTKQKGNLDQPNVSGMCFLRWSKKKPKPIKDCLLLVATFIGGSYDYTLFQILMTDGENEAGEQSWYWGIFTADGDEWGDYSDLQADLYCTMKMISNSKKHLR